MNFLRRISLFSKILFIQFFLFGIMILIFRFFVLENIKKYIEDIVILTLQEKVKMGIQIFESLEEQVRKGNLTENEAKELAIELLSKMKPAKNDYFFIFDDDLIMIFHINPALVNKDVSNLSDKNGKLLIQEMRDQLLKQNYALVDYMWNKPGTDILAPKVTYVLPFPQWKWNLALGIHLDDVEENFLLYVREAYAIIVGIFFVGAAIFYILIWFLKRDLRDVKDIYNNISMGNFVIRKKTGEESKDEIGILKESVYKSINVVSGIFDDIIPASISVEEASWTLQKISTDLKTSIDKMYRNFQNISASIEEITVTFGEISKSIQKVDKESNEAMQEVNTGLAMSSENARVVQMLQKLFQNVSADFEKFYEDSQKIQQVTGIIKEIAEQTNLIALNASIESVKTNERGSRFSVIAEEIRKLANTSRESSLEISNIVKTISQNILNFQKQIGVLGNDIQKLAENFENFTAIVKRVLQTFSSLNLQITQIAGAVEELHTAAKEIARNVDGLSQETQEILKLSSTNQEMSIKLDNVIDRMREIMKGIKTESYKKYMLDLAKSDHIIYANRLASVVDRKLELKDEFFVAHTDCRFGKWYYSEETQDLKNYREFQQLEAPHKKFHDLSFEIYTAMKENKVDVAREKLEEMRKISEQIFAHMEVLKKLTT